MKKIQEGNMKKAGIIALAVLFVFSFVSNFNTVTVLDDQEMSQITGKGGKGGGGGGSTYTPPVDADGLASWEFYDKFVTDSIYYWNGVDYSFNSPDGYTDSDYDGQIDCNDSVIIIETLKNMGYDVPETSIDGLFYNYYTNAGYDTDMEEFYTRNDFDYTKTNLVDEEDLKDGDWWMLDEGDLIFVDFDNDFDWDNAAIYLGWYGGYSNAALVASDYHDRALVVDLDDENSVLNLDIEFGFTDSRSLDYYNIEDYF
jgi:hypothetical protein